MEAEQISLDLIDAPLIVARATLDEQAMDELAADLRTRGFEYPLIVARYFPEETPAWPPEDPRWQEKPREAWARYRVVDGYRRWRAAQAIGLLTAPCIVKTTDEAGELETLLRTALHRADLNPVEEGAVFAAMLEGLHLSAGEIAHRVGKSAPFVLSRLTLVQGPADVRAAVQDGVISFSVALQLLRCDHPADRERLLYHAARGGCTVDVMRGWVQEAATTRRLLPANADPAAPIVTAAAPPTLHGVCNWHDGAVPLDSLLSITVCPSCYRLLQDLRAEVARRDAAAAGGGEHGAGA